MIIEHPRLTLRLTQDSQSIYVAQMCSPRPGLQLDKARGMTLS
jgi:hypothetical protein